MNCADAHGQRLSDARSSRYLAVSWRASRARPAGYVDKTAPSCGRLNDALARNSPLEVPLSALRHPRPCPNRQLQRRAGSSPWPTVAYAQHCLLPRRTLMQQSALRASPNHDHRRANADSHTLRLLYRRGIWPLPAAAPVHFFDRPNMEFGLSNPAPIITVHAKL